MKKIRQNIYRNRTSRYERLRDEVQKAFNFISWMRGGAILFTILSYFVLRDSPSPVIAYGAPLLFALLFFVGVIIHEKQARMLKRLEVLIDINREGVSRLEDKWPEFSFTGEEFLKETTPYLSDLYIFGENSLFQMIHACATRKGTEQLANWLSEYPDFSIIPKRQEAVKEMIPLVSLRQHLLMEGRLIEKRLDPRQFLDWVKSPSFLIHKRWLVVLQRSIVSITLLLIVLSVSVGIPSYWMIGIIAQTIIFAITIGKCRSSYMPALNRDSHFLAYGRMFGLIESRRFRSSYLKSLHEKLNEGESAISSQMKRLERINDSLCQCYSSIYPLLNILFLWDIHHLYRLERWKEEMAPILEICFDVLGETEALSSLAGFGHDNPDYTYPMIEKNSVPLSAENLAHPLIPAIERICNDFHIKNEGFLALITGSNMSGKSTFIRTIGINFVLAFSGAPVAATNFIARPCRIITCIQVTDSLRQHTSHFYAEVKAIKRILDMVNAKNSINNERLPVLYLIDEIFSGTNTRERLIASKSIIMNLANSLSYGFLTTHDLDLVTLEKGSSNIKNFHFMDNIDKRGKMFFDYKIKDGPVTSTNALEIIKMEGIEIDSKTGTTFPILKHSHHIGS